MTTKVLFVCSMNQWRSPTAEKVFQKDARLSVRSKGTSRSARRTVTAQDLKWADVIMVMESKHKQRLRSDFPGQMRFKRLHVLEIPDEYQYMDPDLVELFEAIVPTLI